MNQPYTRSRLLTTPEELKQKLENPNLCLIDTRPADQFAQGRIPGAVHFDLFGISLIDTTPAPLKAFMWMMQHLFEMRGVDFQKEVVFYEETSGMRAARGVWFLDYFGHPNARLLDGGIRAWKEAGYPVTTEARASKASRLDPKENSDVLATAEDVLRGLGEKDTAILDTRSLDEYTGKNARAARGGAVPGAIHIEWTENLDPGGRFKSDEQLKTMYEKAGITSDREVITYCQGGYRAAHTYLALRLIGYPKVRNYIGSWKEWGDRADLPIEKPGEQR